MPMQPTMLSIMQIGNAAFSWHVSFTKDPRLPRSGLNTTFKKALRAASMAIKTINDNGAIPTVDKRPPEAQ